MDPTYHGRSANVPSRRPTGRFHFSSRTILFAALVVVALIAGNLLLSAGKDQTGPLQQRLSVRLSTFSLLIAQGTKNIQDPDLRTFNSRLNTQLLSDQQTIAAALKAAGMEPIPKEISTAEADTATFTTLKEAELNSQFDAVYRKVLAQKLDSTTALMQEVYGKTRSKNLKDALTTGYRNFKQLENQLATTSS